MARVQMVAMTSNDLPRMQLEGNSGSYSHMAAVISTDMILVMWDMMKMLPSSQFFCSLLRCQITDGPQLTDPRMLCNHNQNSSHNQSGTVVSQSFFSP